MFRNIRVDPVDAMKFGIQWQDSKFLDLSVAFGWTHGSAAFQRLSDAIVYIMRRHGCRLFAYSNDYVSVTPADDAERQFNMLSDLLNRLGLPMNRDKKTPPNKVLTCLGIDININDGTLSIEQQKLESIIQ